MIEYTFTYKVPDMFGTTLTEENLSEEKIYHGPEFFYVTLTEDNKINTIDKPLAKDEVLTQENIDNWRDGKPYILVDAKEYPLVAYLVAQVFTAGDVDDDDEVLKEKHYTLEGETEPFFSHIVPIMIEDVYDSDNIIYDQEQETFIVPMIDHTTRENYFERRDYEIEDATRLIQSGTLNKAQVIALSEYIEAFTGIEIKYADYPHHMWPRPDYPLGDEPEEGDPDHPDFVIITDDDSDVDEEDISE
jgi:hypothetical protein